MSSENILRDSYIHQVLQQIRLPEKISNKAIESTCIPNNITIGAAIAYAKISRSERNPFPNFWE